MYRNAGGTAGTRMPGRRGEGGGVHRGQGEITHHTVMTLFCIESQTVTLYMAIHFQHFTSKAMLGLTISYHQKKLRPEDTGDLAKNQGDAQR